MSKNFLPHILKIKEKAVKTMTCLITMRSETYALRAERVLKGRGISAKKIKLDGEYSSRGCSYGIQLDCRNRAVALSVLNEINLPYSDFRSL